MIWRSRIRVFLKGGKLYGLVGLLFTIAACTQSADHEGSGGQCRKMGAERQDVVTIPFFSYFNIEGIKTKLSAVVDGGAKVVFVVDNNGRCVKSVPISAEKVTPEPRAVRASKVRKEEGNQSFSDFARPEFDRCERDLKSYRKNISEAELGALRNLDKLDASMNPAIQRSDSPFNRCADLVEIRSEFLVLKDGEDYIAFESVGGKVHVWRAKSQKILPN